MRAPSRRYEITADLAIEPTEVRPDVVHRHVMKHPFGLGSVYGRLPRDGTRRWNREGWADLLPPVLTQDARRDLVPRIRALQAQTHACGAELLGREEFKGEVSGDNLPCDGCPDALLSRCADLVPDVAQRYASWLDHQLAELVPAVRVERREFSERVFGAFMTRAKLPTSVLSVGLLTIGDPGIRVSTSDGVRSEFYFYPGVRPGIGWRTTHRSVPRNANDQLSFLLELLPDHPRLPLSGSAFVARQWWKEGAQ